MGHTDFGKDLIIHPIGSSLVLVKCAQIGVEPLRLARPRHQSEVWRRCAKPFLGTQIIRLFYPCILHSNDGILITDIDILPMNRTYFTQNIQNYDNDKFIYYRENICLNENQIAMCYNVATPKIWKDVFNINSKEDIINKIKNIYSENNTWFADQITLFKHIKNWKLKQTSFVRLNEKETKFKRLDRNTFDTNNIETIISNNSFTDYHCLRPMSKYSEINNKIVDLL